MSEKKTGLDLLREPFPEHQINLLPRPHRKDSPKGHCHECGGYHGLPAIHLKFVGHAALTDRLLDCDPEWNWEPLALDEFGLPRLDREGGLWIKLTVCGITRLGYGDAQGKTGGDAMKERIGDALRNAAMRFGAALDLWHKGDLHIDVEEADKHRKVKQPEKKEKTEAEPKQQKTEAHYLKLIQHCANIDQLASVWRTVPSHMKKALEKDKDDKKALLMGDSNE